MYLIQTVQTSWRPQLPLPKEIHLSDDNINNDSPLSEQKHNLESAEMLNNNHNHNKKDASFHGSQLSSTGNQSGKKWSFGRLFRKKKEVDSDSTSEEDRKAGFIPATQKYTRNSSKSAKNKSKSQRNNKIVTGSGFDHIVAPQPSTKSNTSMDHQHIDNEFFLPVETISPPPPLPNKSYQEPYYQNQQFLQPTHQSQQQPQLLQEENQQQVLHSRSTNSLDRRALQPAGHKSRSTQRQPNANNSVGLSGCQSSSEEELISLNSSTFSKFRSDESIHSGGLVLAQAAGAQSRRSRAARNERYYKRLSRDGEQSHGQVPAFVNSQPSQRFKTQPVPLSIYNGNSSGRPSNSMNHLRTPSNTTTASVHNSDSLPRGSSQNGYVQWSQLLHNQPPKLQNSVNENKRSISYDSQIHLQNINGRVQSKPLPPPPPPRDPLRRVHIGNHLANYSSGDLRPISYAFDQTGVPVLPSTGLTNRCVSDDRIWAGHVPHYQSANSLNNPSTFIKDSQIQQQQQQRQTHAPQTPHNRRFITRAERDAQPSKKSLPNGLEYHYIADATPRSRKPIHMLDQDFKKDINDPPSSGILRTSKSGLPEASNPEKASEYYRRLDEGSSSMRRGRNPERQPIEPIAKPRSISSSRLSELRSYPIPMYSEINKNRRKPLILSQEGADEVDNIICGTLHIKPNNEDLNNSYIEIRNKDVNKSHSMPNHYQRSSSNQMSAPNKYEEYVAEKKEKHHKPLFNSPIPPQRIKTLGLNQDPPTPSSFLYPRQKPTNLEEAINELEAIYRSLGLSEEPEKKDRVPTPSEFEKFALAHADSYDDEDSPTGEPDPVKDDVAFRSIKLANLQHKSNERQPPFGIPIGPIVAAPQTDYLHVPIEPIEQKKERKEPKKRSPDIVTDDLAVRALRKDPLCPKEKFIYPLNALQKKNRATRTQSANIYSLIQRDAAKPSGGDLFSFMELTRSIDRAGSMSDLHKTNTANDIPSTLALLRNLKMQEEEQQQQLEEKQKQERNTALAREMIVAPTSCKKAAIPFRHPSQGGAICQLPERLVSPKGEAAKAPVPLPRKSLTPEPLAETNERESVSPSLSQMDEALNRIVQEAQESSLKLTKELQELKRREILNASKPSNGSNQGSITLKNEDEKRLANDLKEIEAVSEAAKRCGKMLLENLPDANEISEISAKTKKLHKEDELIEAIDQVSEAANAVCEKILKDIVTTEPPVIVQEAVQYQNISEPMIDDLVMPKLLKKLDVIQSDRIEAIAKRCMRQLSELADQPDYDNLNGNIASTSACNEAPKTKNEAQIIPETTLISTVPEISKDKNIASQRSVTSKERASDMKRRPQELEEIDKIMQECEAQAKAEVQVKSDAKDAGANAMTGSGTGSSNSSAGVPLTFSSSSDCLAKSSSPSASRRLSSSITSFNPYSSSDYLKSPSSDYHALSTDPIKTFSTTSYDVESTSATPNITTNSTFSYTPSPPLNLTPVSGHSGSNKALHPLHELRAASSSPSQYNSSEELAMIFGIEERPKQKHLSYQQYLQNKHQQQLQQHQQNQPNETALSNSGKVIQPTDQNHMINASASESASASASETASTSASSNVLNAFDCIARRANQEGRAPPVYAPVIATTATTTTFTKETNQANGILETNPLNFSFNQPLADIPSQNDPFNLNTFNSPSNNLNYKLETIPELEDNSNDSLKLSPNFNKIYNSEISIVVDKPSDNNLELSSHQQLVENLRQMTQMDSLSSLEETSSNPDSGNVSLSDFPLNSSHANASLQLQSSFNSRFEIKTSFINEVSIETANENPILNSPPPQEQQEDITESEELTEECEDCDQTQSFQFEELSSCSPEILKVLKSNQIDKIPNNLEMKHNVEEAMEQNGNETSLNNQEIETINEMATLNSQLINETTKVKPQPGERLINDLDEEIEMLAQPEDQVLWNNSDNRKFSLTSIVDFSELDLSDLELSEQELSILEDLKLDEAVENPSFALIQRSNIIIETPRINMNISEVKITYEDEEDDDDDDDDDDEDKECLDPETLAENQNVENLLDKENLMCSVSESSNSDQEYNSSSNSIRLSETELNNQDNEKPSTSLKIDSENLIEHASSSKVYKPSKGSKTQENETLNLNTAVQSLIPWSESRGLTARFLPHRPSGNGSEKPSSVVNSNTTVSIYGELRPTNTLTTLEHILVACTLGVLSPNDLFTLFIIILGMMIIFAIALF